MTHQPPAYFAGTLNRRVLILHGVPAGEGKQDGAECDEVVWLLAPGGPAGSFWSATHRYVIGMPSLDGVDVVVKSDTGGRMAFAGLASLETPEASEDASVAEKLLWSPQSRVKMLLNHFIDARGSWNTRRQRFWARLEGQLPDFTLIEDGEPKTYTEIWDHRSCPKMEGQPELLVISCRAEGVSPTNEAYELASLHGLVILSFPIAIVQLGKQRPPEGFVSKRYDFRAGKWELTDVWGKLDKGLLNLPALMGSRRLKEGEVVEKGKLNDGTRVVWKVEVAKY